MPTNQGIPQILRDIPPERFRELVEAILGAPLKRVSSGSRYEVIEKPTDEQRRQENVELAGGKIMLLHRRERLHFETDWTPRGEVSKFALSDAQMAYLGAVADSRFLSSGKEVLSADRWKELTKRDLVEVEGELPDGVEEETKAERTATGGQEVVERRVKLSRPSKPNPKLGGRSLPG